MTHFHKQSFFSFRNVPFWASFVLVVIVVLAVWPR
jgi:hypothetical protein